MKGNLKAHRPRIVCRNCRVEGYGCRPRHASAEEQEDAGQCYGA